MAEDSARLLVCNNLLHHMTNKRETLRNWTGPTREQVFNENTVHWTSSWFWPSLMRALELASGPAQVADRTEARSAQCLVGEDELEALVREHFDFVEEAFFLGRRTYCFLCAVFSALPACYGPPTPPLWTRRP